MKETIPYKTVVSLLSGCIVIIIGGLSYFLVEIRERITVLEAQSNEVEVVVKTEIDALRMLAHITESRTKRIEDILDKALSDSFRKRQSFMLRPYYYGLIMMSHEISGKGEVEDKVNNYSPQR